MYDAALARSPSWTDSGESMLDARSFIRLMENDIPYLRIPAAASAEECEALVAAATEIGFSAYRNVEPKINRIGLTAFEYNRFSEDQYFADVRSMNAVQQRIFARSFDPLQRMLGLVRDATGLPVRLARKDGVGDYYAGLVRRIEEGTLIHVDFAPGEQARWAEISDVRYQLAWNLYLRISEPGEGMTHVFDRQWREADDAWKTGSYGYEPAVVAGAEEAVFAPVVGEIVLFNTRNYHYVEEIAGERVTFTSALGLLPSDEVVFWS